MNPYCGMARHSRYEGYCAGCPQYDCGSITGGCEKFRNFLSVIASCLEGHPNGEEPCNNCVEKGEWNCPLYGPDKGAFNALREELPYDYPQAGGE